FPLPRCGIPVGKKLPVFFQGNKQNLLLQGSVFPVEGSRPFREEKLPFLLSISPIEDGLSAQGILLSFPKFLGLPCLWGYILHIVLSYRLKPHECLVTKSLRFLSALLHRLRCCFDCRPL